MHKLRVFCILFFSLSAVAFQHGCAKKIDSAMSSAGIDDGKSAGTAVKQDKPGGIPVGKADKEAESKAIGEEITGSASPQGDAGREDRISETGETSSQGISGSLAPEKGDNQATMESIEKKPVIIEGQDGALKGTETGIGEAKEEMAKIEAEPSDPRKGGGESIKMPESRQDGISSEVMKKDEEKPVMSPEKEIMVASKVEPGPVLEGLRKGREDTGLKDIFFDFNSWIVKGEFVGTLEQDAKYLILNPGLKVLIEGHADERGTNEYNLALGERRAKSTRKFLVDMGVGPERITILSYGEERPFCRDQGDSCWGNNRRGHFLIIDE
ncbi:MAG TPA: OmpA family protein [Nitrospiria bacterium]|nr:OmpA family protein [Nitrospiria bacterium]